MAEIERMAALCMKDLDDEDDLGDEDLDDEDLLVADHSFSLIHCMKSKSLAQTPFLPFFTLCTCVCLVDRQN